MCTAATYKTKDFYMGRTLDYEFSYGEQITITPRNYEFDFRFAGKIKSHYALIGMAFVAGADRGFAIDPFYHTGKLYGEETDGACRRKKFDGFWNGKKQCEDLCAIQ